MGHWGTRVLRQRTNSAYLVMAGSNSGLQQFRWEVKRETRRINSVSMWRDKRLYRDYAAQICMNFPTSGLESDKF